MLPMADADPLPNEEQRRLLCEMIAVAFVEIRLLGWEGKAQQAADLADAFHNVPREMYGWGLWKRRTFRGGLEDYQRKYHGDSYCGRRDYLKMFDAIFGPPPADQPPVECWLAPWQAISPPDGAPLEAELRKELSPGHPLFGLSFSAIGRRSDQDDVLVVVHGDPERLAVAHLTWRSAPESDPQWPNTEFFDGERDWTARRMLEDHAEWLSSRSEHVSIPPAPTTPK
jgi:hypothetical protein